MLQNTITNTYEYLTLSITRDGRLIPPPLQNIALNQVFWGIPHDCTLVVWVLSLNLSDTTYSQWNWFWHFSVFCNNSSISQPNLMFNTAFFPHWSVDSVTHLNFENQGRFSDFRDNLQRQVTRKILSFSLIGQLSDSQNSEFFICFAKMGKFWLKTHPDSLLW